MFGESVLTAAKLDAGCCDMSVYASSQHHGLQVSNFDNIVMSYAFKTYYNEVWLVHCLGST